MVTTIDYLVARSKHVALWDPFCDQTVKMKGGGGFTIANLLEEIRTVPSAG